MIILTLIISLFCMPAFCADTPSHVVLVSVAPHKYFVERVAGDTLKVMLMVPAGASAHTFEPKPKQMMEASQADIWFRLGESFESRAIPALQSHNPNLKIVDLRNGINLIYAESEHDHGVCHCCGPNTADLHIWMSPRDAKMQVQHIAYSLSNQYPEHAQRYQIAAQAFLKELDELDAYIFQTLKPLKNRVILVSHPAYAYLCRDYGIKQFSIECEGREPNSRQLTDLICKIKAANIRKIFVQPQYSNKGALLVAKQINAEVITLDPYAEDYMNSMRNIVENFGSQ